MKSRAEIRREVKKFMAWRRKKLVEQPDVYDQVLGMGEVPIDRRPRTEHARLKSLSRFDEIKQRRLFHV